MKTCTFCGHHDAPDSIRTMLLSTIEKMIVENKVDTFYVGNHGSFDSMALFSLREMRKEYPQISYYVVLAYLPEKKEEFPLYTDNETILPDGIENYPKRFAITYRNKWMVEQSEYLIAYVKNSFGGASKTLEYATKRHLNIIEI
ncbi:hypothetical protein LI142_13675 [Eubacterium limosum]|uniref:hypothetical protein n=1 Tax=Eubacterium limosum TaxID=1736 RepID=UPI001D095703|nr:hypothetical protein [Eubacterium limosum]MCB6570549.1 hypothetical protein [Eubacterium limosum]